MINNDQARALARALEVMANSSHPDAGVSAMYMLAEYLQPPPKREVEWIDDAPDYSCWDMYNPDTGEPVLQDVEERLERIWWGLELIDRVLRRENGPATPVFALLRKMGVVDAD